MRSAGFNSLRYVGTVVCLVAVFSVVHARKVRGAEHPDDMVGHMTMTKLRPVQPGDKAKADAILVSARKAADQYKDYRKALADGYTIFHPELKQNVYHFTNNTEAIEATMYFDAAKPTSYLYEKVAGVKAGEAGAYKLVGVMYTAPFRFTEDQLNQRVPLSIAEWHLHTNLCLPPAGERGDLLAAGAKFGLRGSITTAEACEAAGGKFMPHLFGWMVHVYPYEKDPAKVWVEGMDDDHGMQHDAMPMGMQMGPGGR